MPNLVYILLGSNLGESKQNLVRANQLIKNTIGSIDRKSSLYKTAAWGKTDQAAFINQVILVRTKLNAREFLQELLAIETQMGRVRINKWEPRVIDLDILFYGKQILQEEDLVIPHPQLQNRKFTLIPLVEIAPNFVHPVLKKNMEELLAICNDNLTVEKLPIK